MLTCLPVEVDDRFDDVQEDAYETFWHQTEDDLPVENWQDDDNELEFSDDVYADFVCRIEA
jgi:hypothetical protein